MKNEKNMFLSIKNNHKQNEPQYKIIFHSRDKSTSSFQRRQGSKSPHTLLYKRGMRAFLFLFSGILNCCLSIQHSAS